MTDLIKPKQAAERLGMSTSYVYALARTGAIKSYRMGAALRFDPQDVQNYKASCQSQNSPTAGGASSSTGSFVASGYALQNYFQKAGPRPKPMTSTGAKQRGSTSLRLVVNNQRA
jgi:excisionase family DNA binding protein